MSQVRRLVEGQDVRIHFSSFVRTDRYGVVLGLLVITYLLSALTGNAVVDVVKLVLFVTTLLVAVRTSRVNRMTGHVIRIIGLAGTAFTGILWLAGRTGALLGIVNIWTGLVLLVTVVIIIRRILSHTVVSIHTILGALSAYLIIGLMFTAFYAAMSRLSSEPFFVQTRSTTGNLLQYFSFTTLTTLGYGDYTASGNLRRSIAVLEALIGQIFLVTLVARLVSAFEPGAGATRSRQRIDRRQHPRSTRRSASMRVKVPPRGRGGGST